MTAHLDECVAACSDLREAFTIRAHEKVGAAVQQATRPSVDPALRQLCECVCVC